MYSFKENNGLSLFCGDTEIMTGIIPWVNTRLKPFEMNLDDYIFASRESLSGDSASFVSENGAYRVTLKLLQDKNAFAISMTGSYDPDGTLGHGSHVNDLKGFGFLFDAPYKDGFLDCYMYGPFWQKTHISDDITTLKQRTQYLTLQQQGHNLLLVTSCHKDYKSELFPHDGRINLVSHSNCVKDDIDEIVLIGATSEDAYSLPETASAFGIRAMGKKRAKLRKSKKYPEVFEYLGWCSWDAFHMDVTDRDLYSKAKEFADKEIPVKWMIIDDMWGHVVSIDRKSMHGRELSDWEADPIRFPQGLKGAVTNIKRDFDLKVGIWHPTSGYWAGINPSGELNKKHGDLLEYVTPRIDGYYPILMHSFKPSKINRYYDLQHSFYNDCGIDFTKVDNQGSTERFSYNKGSIGECSENLHKAIERTADKYYGGSLINCMGMPIENLWNRGATAVNRFSGDFQPENRKWFIQHLLQCSFNSFTQGAIYVGDWDMWWSDDAQARKNAVLRAMSGGPVYMSDELGRSIKEVIMPTVLSDGKIIRLSTPALPTEDCLFTDSEHNGKIFKVFNRSENGGYIAAFDISEDESTVKGHVSPSDVYGIKRGKYCLYDWFDRNAYVLDRKQKMKLSLESYDDFRLYSVCRIVNGVAVIGLMEKYMTLDAIKVNGSSVTALDDGTLLIYSERELKGFTKEQNGLWSMKVTKGQTVTVE